jgi:hypothetical protein
MTKLRLLAAILSVFACGAYAQTGDRASTPPGVSQDGAKPADGAIQGGSILPGEKSGVPDAEKMRERCEQLSGTLREDCLKQQRDAGLASEPRMKSPEPAGSAAGSSSSPR